MADRYWVGGTANWDGTAGTKWAATSGGAGGQSVPTSADDVFFDAASSGTVTIAAGNTGAKSINCTGFTGTIAGSTAITVSGNITLSAGMTYTHSGTVTINANSTLITASKTFSPLTINGSGILVTLGDSLISSGAITLTLGGFDAVTYNVTATSFSSTSAIRFLNLGTGLWTLTGTGTVWSIDPTNLDFNKNTADILLSNTTTSARTFEGGALSYNKLTIGGTTGTSTLTIGSNNYFGELASTKTVAHTIAFGSTVQNFGKWTVTGTAGNVVTLTGTSANHMLSGPATSGIDYLAMGSVGFNGSTVVGGTYYSPGEFYAGPNSTGTTSNSATFRTAPPSPRTLYWVGGTGNWSNTAKWSLASGGAGGEAIPTSLDDVIFNSASNATAYTATIDTTVRCKSITITGPASGNITLAGTGQLIVHNQLTYPATGMTRTHSGEVTLSGTGSGKVITTNGITLGAALTLRGYNVEWSLGSAISTSGSGFELNFGTFNTANYNFTGPALTATNYAFYAYTLNLGSSSITTSGFIRPIDFGSTYTQSIGRNLNAGTSSITCTGSFTGGITFTGGGKTFYNVTITLPGTGSGITGGINLNQINGNNTFNNLTITITSGSPGAHNMHLLANQTITGTFSFSGPSIISRAFLLSNIQGTPRTVTAATITANNCDFRDITISGAASPISPTSAGDCGGNSNITFPAAKTVYWNLAGSVNWTSTGWATSDGGSPASGNFPLVQDTAIFTDAGSAGVVSMSGPLNIGTVNMSSRTSALRIETGEFSTLIHGNWMNGSGTTLTGGSTNNTGLTFAGRTTQQLTSNSRTFGMSIYIEKFAGSLQLMDAFTGNNLRAFNLISGTLDLQSYTLTVLCFNSSNSNTRTLAFGTGNITVTAAGDGATLLSNIYTTQNLTGLTVTGTPIVNVTHNTSNVTTVIPGSAAEANTISFNFTAGTYTLTLNGTIRDLNFTGFAGTLANSARTIFGSLTISSGMTLTAGTSTSTFASTSGVKTITSNSKTFDFPITFNGVGGAWQLQDALTVGSSRTMTLTNGTLDMDGKTLTSGLFSSVNSNVRTLAFGSTGKMVQTGSGAVWNVNPATNLSVTGNRVVDLVYSGALSSTTNYISAVESQAISFNFTAGTYTLTMGGSGYLNVDFTGFSGTLNNGARTIFGNLTLSTGMTLTAGSFTTTFAATSGIKTLTSNGKTMDYPLIFDGVGGTWQLQDALTIGSTRSLLFYNGTIDLAGKTFTAGSTFSIFPGTKNITFNGGTLVCPDSSSSAFNNGNPTGFTTTAGTGTGTITMTGASAKTFGGGGSVYNCTINQGGAGALTITGNNTFNDITNTVQPASILFTAGTTTTFNNFNLNGTAGNLITIGSVIAASHTLSKASGTVSVNYLSISRSIATGGATWEAFTTNGNVNGGNNLGWIFSLYSAGSQFFAFF